MDESDDPREIARKLEQANRVAANVSDLTTMERINGWAVELRERLKRVRDAHRLRQETRTRARELWEQSGCPPDRDVEFWLQAEREIEDRVTNGQTTAANRG